MLQYIKAETFNYLKPTVEYIQKELSLKPQIVCKMILTSKITSLNV